MRVFIPYLKILFFFVSVIPLSFSQNNSPCTGFSISRQTATVCEGGTIAISVSATNAQGFTWQGPNGFSSTLQAPQIPNASSSNAGTYSVTITNTASCTASTTLTVAVTPQGIIPAANTEFCPGGSANLGVDGGPNATYLWSTGATQANVTVKEGGTFSVDIRDKNGCRSKASFVVLLKPLPVINMLSNSPLCTGGTIRLSATGGGSYEWVGPNFSSSAQNPTITNAQVQRSGVYTAQVTGTNNCYATATISVLVTSKPTPTPTSNSPVCAGDKLILSVATGQNYTWAGTNDFKSTLQNPVLSGVDFSYSGVYSVTVTATGGCTASETVSVTIVAAPVGNVGVVAPVCTGSSLSLSASGGSQYRWAGPSGFSSTLSNPSIPNANTSFSGEYTVTIGNVGNCNALLKTQVEVLPAPKINLKNPEPSCVGIMLSLTASGNDSYVWAGPAGFSSSQNKPINIELKLEKSGVYSVTISNELGCTASNTVAIEAEAPSIKANANSRNICQNAVLNLSVTSGDTYAWAGPDAFSSTLQNPTIPNVGMLQTGQYSVTVTKGGCSATDAIGINVSESTPTAFAPRNLCEGNTLAMSVSAGDAYQWAGVGGFSSTLQSPTIANSLPIHSGTYSVTVSSASGCNGSAEVAITVNPKPALVATSNSNNGETLLCMSKDTLKLEAKGGVSYLWRGANGFTSTLQKPQIASLSLSNAGVYSVATLTEEGCSASATLSIAVKSCETPKPYGSVGNYVWKDSNKNGLQNTGEPGIKGVKVLLLKENNTVFSIIDSVLTTDTGAYLFDSLNSGNYKIRFVYTNPACVLTTEMAGNSPQKDSDANPNGETGLITIDTALAENNIGRNNLDIDAGYILKEVPPVVVCSPPAKPTVKISKSDVCKGESIELRAESSNAQILRWYTAATGGSIAKTTTSEQPWVINPTQSLSYYVEAANDTCKSARTEVKVTVKTPSLAPVLTLAVVNRCPDTFVNLNGLAIAQTEGYEWHEAPAADSPLVVNPAGVQASGQYYLLDKNGCYATVALASVNILRCNCTNPVSVNINKDSWLCLGDTVAVSGRIENTTKYEWTSNGTGVFEDNKTLYVKYLPSKLDKQRGFVSLTLTASPEVVAADVMNLCEPVSEAILISFPKPFAASAIVAKDSVLCIGQKTTLSVPSATGRVRWYLSNETEKYFEKKGSDIYEIAPNASTTYYAENVSLGGCTNGQKTAITIKVIRCKTDLAIEKKILTPAPYKTGQLVVYALTVVNLGTNPADSVVVTDVLPKSLSFESASAANEYHTAMGHWQVGTLGAGANKTLKINAIINDSGIILNRASVSSSDNDLSKTTNDSSSVSISVEDNTVCNVLAPTLTCSTTSICGGDSLLIYGLGCGGKIEWSTGQTGGSISVRPSVSTTYTGVCVVGKCRSEKSEINIEVGAPKPVLLSCPNPAICMGSATTITAKGCENGMVVWGNGMVGTSITVKPSETTGYVAYCKSGTCLSEASKTLTISVTAAIPKIETADLVNVCPQTTVNLWNGVLSKPTTKGGVFEFHTDNSPTSPLLNDDPTKIGKTGRYYIYERTPIGCVSEPCGISVFIIDCKTAPPPCENNPATAKAGKDTLLCGDLPLKLNGKIGGAATSSQWNSRGTGTFDNALLTNAYYTPSAEDLRKGSVWLVLATNDPDGNTGVCKAAKDSLKLTFRALASKPVVVVIGALNLCAGDTVKLSVAKSNYACLWSTGDSSQSIKVNKSGVYSVKFKTSDGCGSIASEPVTVQVLAAIPAPKVLEKASNTCPKPQIDLTKAVVSQPTTPDGKFIYQIGESKTSAKVIDPTDVGLGIYYVVERSGLGCYSEPTKIETILKPCLPDTMKPVALADLSLKMTASTPKIKPDQTYDYLLILSNKGPATAKNVSVSNPLPTGISYMSSAAKELSYNIMSRTVSIQIDSIRASQVLVFAYKVRMETGKDTLVSNKAEISKSSLPDPNSTPNNGIALEDDFALVTIVRDTTSTPVVIVPPIIPIGNLLIPEGFSPNGDGQNDTFIIQKKNADITFNLRIYNIWGVVVYDKENYDNSWNGESNYGVKIGLMGNGGLPDGTYFYLIETSAGESYLRYLTIAR